MDKKSLNKKIAALLRRLSSEAHDECIEALGSVIELGPASLKILPRIKALCSDDAQEVRGRALKVVRDITPGCIAIVPFFGIRLIEDSCPLNRVACAYFIVEKLTAHPEHFRTDAGKDVFTLLLRATTDSDSRVRRHVIEALGHYTDNGETLLPHFGLALDDMEEAVRFQAVKSIISCCFNILEAKKIFELRLRFENSEKVLSLIREGLEAFNERAGTNVKG